MKSNPLGVLQKCGALLQGHFQLSSGLHSDRYFQCARVFVDPKVGAKLVKLLVPQLPAATRVIGPALGGILVAYELARQLGVGNVFAERDKGVMTLRRGFELSTGDRVIIAEDVVTTGGSSGEVLQLLRARGVEVLGLACLVDRSSGTAGARLELPMWSVVQVDAAAWKPEVCPLCQAGIPAVKPGSREPATSR